LRLFLTKINSVKQIRLHGDDLFCWQWLQAIFCSSKSSFIFPKVPDKGLFKWVLLLLLLASSFNDINSIKGNCCYLPMLAVAETWAG